MACRQATLGVLLLEQLHHERRAVPGINRFNLQPFQASDADRRGRGIVYQRIECRPFRVLEEIAAEQPAGAVKTPTDPLECPGKERIFASNQY